MKWNPAAYGQDVADILALRGNGERLMPLAEGICDSDDARHRIGAQSADKLFPGARAPQGALSGLYLYFSCRNEAHEVAQEDSSVEGSYWHAIVHRQEPDAGNSSYWFRRVGAHPIFRPLLEEARVIATAYPDVSLQLGSTWNPFAFIDVCEEARRHPASGLERAVLEIQRVEWQLLFDHCARGSRY
jgi:hypothetical protein